LSLFQDVVEASADTQNPSHNSKQKAGDQPLPSTAEVPKSESTGNPIAEAQTTSVAEVSFLTPLNFPLQLFFVHSDLFYRFHRLLLFMVYQ
jgi:hypothetical protein